MDSSTILIILFILLAITIVVAKNLLNDSIRYKAEWRKWETEYWRLRGSEAVDTDNYDIHLSWSRYGEDDCIKKRVKPPEE